MASLFALARTLRTLRRLLGGAMGGKRWLGRNLENLLYVRMSATSYFHCKRGMHSSERWPKSKMLTAEFGTKIPVSGAHMVGYRLTTHQIGVSRRV